MPQKTINQLIINSPYEEPKRHWHYDRSTRLFDLVDGRRPAGYVVASSDSKAFDDPGIFVDIPLINQIRSRVGSWRKAGYPGVTGVTKRLLEYWNDPEEHELRRFFFCQIEAAETLIWLTEASPSERVGIEVPSEGGSFGRLCAKMATGSGKTVVMAMVIAWHVLNKVSYSRDGRFSKYVLVVAPSLTVKDRLAVLDLSSSDNYYGRFRIVPSGMLDKLRQGKVLIRNCHALHWESVSEVAKRRGVDKRGARSDEAYARDVLGELHRARNILVINDEAHHAWRVPAGVNTKSIDRHLVDDATRWIAGLDRIGKARGILACYDFSATPFAPLGKRSSEESLFRWIVSDFGLNDAIESGLVKTPRVVIHDDALPNAETYRSRLYHIYNDSEVKDDLNRKAKETEPLPALVTNAYYLLGYDWHETAKKWAKEGSGTPPVMITIANRTETAARIRYSFDHNKILINELCDPNRTLHIDSKVLGEAEKAEQPIADLAGRQESAQGLLGEGRFTQKQRSEYLRRQVDTVGQLGREGEQIQNVISVGMLSEGWDAKTVTHIMGLRAFTSQLLCEQVVGRGLRRTSYEIGADGLLDSEYVNIFGVPFTFLPHEGGKNGPPSPPSPKTAIEPVASKSRFMIEWPNVIRVERTFRPHLSLRDASLEPLHLHVAKTAMIADMAGMVNGKADITNIRRIDLAALGQEFRTQRIIFETARDVYDSMRTRWQGDQLFLVASLIRLIEEFICSDGIVVEPAICGRDDLMRRLVITLNMTKVAQHLTTAISHHNTKTLEPVFDSSRPIRSTGDMRRWYTGKPCRWMQHNHINYCVFDSTWEFSDANVLDNHDGVAAWVKNDHLGFEIQYVYHGIIRKYRPDFIIKLSTGEHLVLETKGKETDQDRTKWKFLQQWVEAVNTHGGFGLWHCAITRQPGEILQVLAKYTGKSRDGLD